ncbi:MULTISPECIES: hypothetical protein [Bradyrhizobium]|uniref:hypothetical protein n=1 Tax=Bradyrhizobium TaxID=374 RepID=UPI0004B79B3D|nr:hypothetical protein [Bradyrhizobium sp. CCBAU 15544]
MTFVRMTFSWRLLPQVKSFSARRDETTPTRFGADAAHEWKITICLMRLGNDDMLRPW